MTAVTAKREALMFYMTLVYVAPVNTTSTGGGGSGGITAAIVFFVIGGILALVMIISPQTLWRATRWQYRNPDAMEPSDAGYAMQRMGGVIMLITIVVVAVIITSVKSKNDKANQTAQTQQEIQSVWGDGAQPSSGSGSGSGVINQNSAPRDNAYVKITAWAPYNDQVQVEVDSGSCEAINITESQSGSTVTLTAEADDIVAPVGTQPTLNNYPCDPGGQDTGIDNVEPVIYSVNVHGSANRDKVIDGSNGSPVPRH